MANRTKFTPKKEETFLLALTENGNVSKASEIVGISRRRMYDLKKENSDFAAAWDSAVEVYIDLLEAEADRRAREGVEKPVGFHKGEHQGTFVKEFSDTLLIFRLKALRPEKYRERVDAKVTGDVTVVRKVYTAAAKAPEKSKGR